uniref:Uncharacterized protein n=1 Tax=Arundo donax TaxID=35708 RepID=A0A0A8YBQ1_ARUDO
MTGEYCTSKNQVKDASLLMQEIQRGNEQISTLIVIYRKLNAYSLYKNETNYIYRHAYVNYCLHF